MGMIIGLTGYARAGKSTAAKHLVENHGFTELSFAKALKDMALAVNPIIESLDPDGRAWRHADQLIDEGVADVYGTVRLAPLVSVYGWDHAKDNYPEVRGFLQRLGTEGVRGILGDSAWIHVVEDELERLWTADHNEKCDGSCRDYCEGDANLRPIVVADVLVENEADFIRHEGGRVVRIKRTNQTAAGSAHASEVPVQADEVITNFDGDTASMKADLDALVEAMND